MSLKNVCFENIKDEFYYGKFGEFTLVIDKNTGFFNATKLCKDGKKSYSNWYRLERTKLLFNEIIKSCPSHVKGSFLYEKRIPNNIKLNKIIGTYVCKEIILDLASWISPEFYLKCNDIILNYFEREYQSTLKEKDDKIDILLKKVETVELQNNTLLEQNTQTLKKSYSNWYRLERTKLLFNEINTHRPSDLKGGEFVYEIKTQNKSKQDKIISGTYLCKELILDLASWIFYLKCNDIILNYFEREYQSTLKEKDDKKSYSNWYRLERTKLLFNEINTHRRADLHGGEFVYENKQGNRLRESKIISGTYLCKELILDLASWISPQFYLKCNDIILNYFEREYQSTLKER